MKRYKSANAIRDAIDEAKAKFDLLIERSEVQEGLGKDMEAKKLRIFARRIKDNKLDVLKEKLAEFCTDLLPGVITDGDRSIPVSTRKTKPKGQNENR